MRRVQQAQERDLRWPESSPELESPSWPLMAYSADYDTSAARDRWHGHRGAVLEVRQGLGWQDDAWWLLGSPSFSFGREEKGKGALPRLKAIGGNRAPCSSNGSTLASKQAKTIATLRR
ncbi:hypothetical protein PanWU01x14_070600 [Parasponia andersonii]|uniref:Uncharacterized protein n=1 Tax=Parasponia andersonii TaxID=3476 RepID=A0A2P5DF36_PARAD|nr:hypothetical protein PanWU01x14_070600 [Parasponia andersonii]